MPSVLVTDSWDCEVGGQEPWPDDVKLYQPYETEQILLPDNANCLAVQAVMKMCNLSYQVEYKANAESMSPSGRVPFIKCGAFIVSELDPIVNFISNKGISLTNQLDGSEKSDMRAYMSLVNTVLGNAENYVTWVDSTTYNQVTKPRYGSVHPFPLNHVLTYMKRQSIIKKLHALGWYNKTLSQVFDEVDQCCQALSERLETNPFFFGNKPTELDAALFGHVYAILTTHGFPAGLKLAEVIRSHKPIIKHCRLIMPLLKFLGQIEEPCLHPLYVKLAKLDEKINEDEKCDEFVYVDEEDYVGDNRLGNGERPDISTFK